MNRLRPQTTHIFPTHNTLFLRRLQQLFIPHVVFNSVILGQSKEKILRSHAKQYGTNRRNQVRGVSSHLTLSLTICEQDANRIYREINGAVAKGDTLITVIVGQDENTKTYELPKFKLMAVSGYFQAALSGPWVEGRLHTVTLDWENPLSFDLFVQWMYIKQVVIPRVTTSKSRADSECLSIYLNFSKLADYLNVIGPMHTSLEDMEKIIIANPEALESYHIREAGLLPRGNPILRMFAKCSVKPYTRSKFNWSDVDWRGVETTKVVFKHEKELKDVDGFASELLSMIPMKDILATLNRYAPISDFIDDICYESA